MAEGGSHSILDLPEGCLTHTLSFLPRKDLAAAAQSCRTFSSLALSSVVWLQRLREDLDLPLQVCSAKFGQARRLQTIRGTNALNLQATHQRDWRSDYIRLIGPPSQQSLRFLGSFTDGGVDDEHKQYWVSTLHSSLRLCTQLAWTVKDLYAAQVDNLFTSNPWEAYCSKEGKGNINCLGILLVSSAILHSMSQLWSSAWHTQLGKDMCNQAIYLQDQGEKVEHQSKVHRDLLIRRLKYPLQVRVTSWNAALWLTVDLPEQQWPCNSKLRTHVKDACALSRFLRTCSG